MGNQTNPNDPPADPPSDPEGDEGSDDEDSCLDDLGDCYMQGWTNFNSATETITDPNTPAVAEVYAWVYIAGWGGFHLALAGGLLVLGAAALAAGGSALFGACLSVSICAKVIAGTTGITVYRVWGGTSGPGGRSWTPIDPRTVSNYASSAGLPPGNTGQYLTIGQITSMEGVTITQASRILTNPGGLLEYVISNPQVQVFGSIVEYLVP
jgi:hypothetical protein